MKAFRIGASRLLWIVLNALEKNKTKMRALAALSQTETAPLVSHADGKPRRWRPPTNISLMVGNLKRLQVHITLSNLPTSAASPENHVWSGQRVRTLLCTPSHLWLSYKSVTTTCVSTTETSVHVPDVHCFLHQSARKSPWTSQQGFVLFKLVVIIMSLSSKACNAENTVFDCWRHCKLTFRQKMSLSLLLSAMFRHASSQTCLAQLHTWPITARCCSSSQMKGR